MTKDALEGTVRVLRGRARRFGDHINTDYIISSSRKKETIDPAALKQWLLEAVDPAFAASVRPGDILVAGEDFGCGSAMEVAATVLLAAGISAVVARSFAGTYFRNAINNGLIPIECDTTGIAEGDALEIRISAAAVDMTVTPGGLARDHEPAPVEARDRDLASARADRGRPELAATALPAFILEILAAGGLVKYLRDHGGFPEAGS